MDNNSNSKMNELLKQKNEYKKKIIEIEEEIEKLLKDEVNNCEHEWIKERANTGYVPLSDAVDITTYFDKDYGSTIFSDTYFIKLANNENLEFINRSVGTCCDRQDIYVFKKIK